MLWAGGFIWTVQGECEVTGDFDSQKRPLYYLVIFSLLWFLSDNQSLSLSLNNTIFW